MQVHTFTRRCAWTCLAALLVISSTSYGWNDTGHQIIASIVFDELTPAVRTAAADLLKQHPRYEKDLLDGMPEGFDAQRYSFMIAATWPDIVRNQNHPMHFVANHPAWHYIDIPFVQSGFTPASAKPAEPAVPGDPQDILEALSKVTAELRDPTLAPGDRAIALCWVLHLCGDLHQPLHAVNFYSAQYPDGDKGGNSIIVLRMPNQFYTQTNLHALWDQMLGAYRSPAMLGYIAAGLHGDPHFARDQLRAELGVHDFAQWAKESHDLAVTQCYLNGSLEGASQDVIHADRGAKIPALPPGYIANGEAVAARRAILAAYRTADLLNSLLQPQPAK
jgi:hypothetical protein